MRGHPAIPLIAVRAGEESERKESADEGPISVDAATLNGEKNAGRIGF